MHKPHKYDIIGLGFCGLDYLCLTPYIPADDKVEALATLIQGGGPAATAIFTAARLGARTAFLGSTGDDERGKSIISGLHNGGVDTRCIAIRPGSESPSAFCWIEKSTGCRSIVWNRGGVRPIEPQEIDVEVIKSAKLLHLDGHQTKAAIHCAQIARDNGVIVAIDAGTIVPGIEKLLEMANIIIASKKFAERFVGESDPEKSAKKLFGASNYFSAVTIGSEGSIGFDGNHVFRQSAFNLEVVDTTGAGDVFHGAFAYKYVNGGDWQACLRFAAAVAALKCTKLGGRTGIPSLSEAEKYLKEHE